MIATPPATPPAATVAAPLPTPAAGTAVRRYTFSDWFAAIADARSASVRWGEPFVVLTHADGAFGVVDAEWALTRHGDVLAHLVAFHTDLDLVTTTDSVLVAS